MNTIKNSVQFVLNHPDLAFVSVLFVITLALLWLICWRQPVQNDQEKKPRSSWFRDP